MNAQGQRAVGPATRAALAAAALVAALSLSAATASAQVPPEFFGVVTQGGLGPGTFERMAQAGAGTLRFRVDWAEIDPSPAADDYDWPIFDPIVLDAARSGVRILPFLYGAPDWVARGLDGRHCEGSQCDAYAPRSKPALDAWQRFVAGAVARYGPGGSLWAEHPTVPPLPFGVWQIWNEQNSDVFFAPRPRPKRYVRLLARASRAIRGVDPSATILLGGMAELAGSRRAVDASGFLKRLYRRRRAAALFDAIATHPYGTTMEKVRTQVRLLRRAARRGGDRAIPMYVTEIGAGSGDGGHAFNLGADGQASLLRRVYSYFLRKRTAYDVRTVDWFSWQDNPAGHCLWCPTSGLLTEDGFPKPALHAYTALSGGS